MNSFNIALNNFKHNLREYGLYMAAIIFAVMVYYNFTALEYNPEVLKTESFVRYATTGSQISSVFLFVFIIFFTWYSNSFFFNRRKKEIGIYIFLGIENHRIALVFALETLIQGVVALTVGLSLGFLFARLFMMALAKVVLLEVSIDFFFSWKSVQKTILVFFTLFTLVSIKNYIDISRSKLIDLFNFARKEEAPPSAGIIKAILAISMIGVAYTLCLIPGYITREENFFYMSNIVILLTLVGTMLLFGSFFPLAMQKITQNKKFLYQGINIVTVSSIAFRVRRIYRTLGVISLMIASCLVALGTSLSLRYYINETFNTETPYSFTYINEVHDPTVQQQVRSTISESGHELLLEEHASFLYDENVQLSEYNERETVIIKYDDFVRIISDLQVKNYESLVEQLKPENGQAIYIEKPGVVIGMSNQKGQTLSVGNQSLQIKEQAKIPLLGKGIPALCLVVTHADYQKILETQKQFEFYAFSVDHQEDTWDLAMDLKAIHPVNESLYAYAEVFSDRYEYIGIFYFLGVFLSLIYFLSTSSILYFKIMSDALVDRDKYEILNKIGLTNQELYRSISRQVGVFFLLPYIVGLCHSMVATSVLEDLMKFDLLLPVVISIIVFSIMYALFYLITTKKYYGLLTEKS